MAKKSLMTELYNAFNPATELRSTAGWYERDCASGELTRQELIIQGCMVRQALERDLPDLDYRILRLLFKRQTVEQASVDLDVIRQVLVSSARIRTAIDPQFVDICCLNECWQTDLFRTTQYGPMKRYSGCAGHPSAMSRRRSRIGDVVKQWREEVVEKADILLLMDNAEKTMVS